MMIAQPTTPTCTIKHGGQRNAGVVAGSGGCMSNETQAPRRLDRRPIRVAWDARLARMYRSLFDLGNVSTEGCKRPNQLQVDLFTSQPASCVPCWGPGCADGDGKLCTSCCTPTLEKARGREQGTGTQEARQKGLKAGKRSAFWSIPWNCKDDIPTSILGACM